MTEDDAQEVVIRLADSDARFPSAARDDLFAWAGAQHPPLI
jgi:hypothetical protein